MVHNTSLGLLNVATTSKAVVLDLDLESTSSRKRERFSGNFSYGPLGQGVGHPNTIFYTWQISSINVTSRSRGHDKHGSRS